MAKRIITISREFGSGGRFIGEKVAKKLGIAYYDKNIINDIAEKSGLSPEYVQKNAELSPKKGLFAYAFAGRDITGKSVEDMEHKDITDDGQTVTIKEVPEIPDTPKDTDTPDTPSTVTKTSDSPKTGDNTNIYAYLAMLGLSCVGLGGMLYFKRRRKKS